MLHLQQASLEKTMEKRFLVEHMEPNLLIKNTLEASLKSFNDFVLFNMNMLMQQRLPPYVEPPPPPSTIVLASISIENSIPGPLPSPLKSPPSNPPPFTAS